MNAEGSDHALLSPALAAFPPMQMNQHSDNAIAKDWDAARSSLLPYERPFLERLMNNLSRPAKVLDLGCGTGRLPEGRWLQAEMETFVPDEDYDGAMVWDALFHIPREHHESILRSILCSLRKGSKLILTVGGSEHPPFTDTMYGQTFFYDSHAPGTVLDILRSLGTSVEHAAYINLPTSGRDKGRYRLVASVP